MKKMKHTLFSILRYACLLALPFAGGGCTLHELPETTPDGEPGVDPTAVELTANLNLNINLGQAPAVQADEEAGEHLHRFVVEAFLNRQPVARQTFVEEITDRTHIGLPVKMKLHARNYRLVVWSDYVKADTPDSDLYYNTESLVPLIPVRPAHTGNTPYKDAFAASLDLDLSPYRDEWNAQPSVDVALQRPVARYELVANDVAAFLRRVKSGEVEGSKFTARIKYTDYLPVGYNVLDDVPKHSLMYMQYTKSFPLPAEGTRELPLAFDYVFVAAGQASSILLEVEIVNERNETVATTALRVPCQRNQNTIVRGAFLTADPDGGIGFDPDYDGEVDLDVEVTPL